MNSQITAEIAAVIASQSLSLIEGTAPLSSDVLCDFWYYGQEHLKQRRRVLEPLAKSDTPSDLSESELEVIFKDFFAEEMLIRVVTTVLAATDQKRKQCQSEPIARSLYLAFLDLKRVVLGVMVAENHLSLDALKRINGTRRSIERWTDLMLGQFVLRYDLQEFAHDPERARDFGEDQSTNLNAPSPVQTWDLITAGLRISFPAGLTSQSSDHWEKMLAAVMACYPEDCFHQSAMMKSIQQIRIARSGLAAETHPDQIPEQFRTLLPHTSSNNQPHFKPTDPKQQELDSAPKKQGISFTHLHKRNTKGPHF
ncbi:MAG: hypothetical protein KDA70_02795 [Planctomycetaceae bacterium]|nr:hypothetical protein [Planctomycetaceae bacterium]